MCNAAAPMPGSILGEMSRYDPARDDAFTAISPDTDWQVTLEHAEKIGLGTRAYTLIRV